MINGIFKNPTIIFFGQGTESMVGEEIKKYSKKILLHYGRGSIKKFGLYKKVTDSLKKAKVNYIELGGVEPNPRASLVYEGIKISRNENIDFILAIGGGSVIDSAKAISIGVPHHGDFFDIFEGKHAPKTALKVATILTMPGTGSESSNAAVITHEKKGLKLPYTNDLMFPVFSILNPESTFTIPLYATKCGIVDAIAHVFERYFTNTTYVDCTDRIGEGIIKTLMKYAVLVQDKPNDYDVRSEIMWACKVAHDNTAGFGRKQDWASHSISHSLGAIYDVAHGAALGVIFPAWMKFVYHINKDRFLQFADRVFEINTKSGNIDENILTAIDRFQKFLKSINMPATLQELGIKDKKRFKDIAKMCVKYMRSGTIGNFTRLSPQDIIKILEVAY